MSTKDELIDEIGHLLQNDPELAGSDWGQMAWAFHVRAGSSNCNGFVYQKEGEAVPSCPESFKILDKLKELRIAMQEPGKELWKACLLRWDRTSGKFTIDFEYDDPGKWLITPINVKAMAGRLRPSSK